jgi:hypothetical protein
MENGDSAAKDAAPGGKSYLSFHDIIIGVIIEYLQDY